MDLYSVLDQVVDLLRQRGRVTYRALKRQFELDDDFFEDLKEELLYAHPEAQDDGGRGLIWNGAREESSSSSQPPTSNSQSPASYTPQHLAERIRAEQAAMESRGAAEGERKTITALFADLKGSTALIEGLDPEDARAIIDPALQLMMDAVHRYEGYVAQSLGDGIFALFGAPIAHEDHPQRALYAALRMQKEMGGYADILREQGRPPLMMRVGINTGEVVVRSIRKDDLHTDYVPVGHSTNLAARMEQLANPGSIVVSDYTHKLTDGYFEFKDLGKTQIKGVEEPLSVYEVIGAGPLRTRLQVSARRGLTRFVGRHSEMEQIQGALDQAKAGHGQIVGVMGEPGLGKSRLFHEFKLTSQSECLVFEAFAVSHGKASPYLPLIELLKNYFQIEPTDDERQRQSKVVGQVLTLDRSLEDTLPYLFSLLGIEEHTSSLQQMDAQIRRQRTFEALKKLFLRESLNQPLLLIFEDLHWIDTETQGFLDVLGESIASAQVVLLVNYRPEYQHQWGMKTYYTQLHLAPLGQAEAEELLTFLLGNDDSLTSLKSLILERTEGTPFFMEEVVQTLVEEGALIGDRGHYRLEAAPTELHIPQTVQGILAARIDRLTTEEKTFIQQLAVIGRQFPASLIKKVIDLPEDALYRVLAALQGKEFLYEQPAFPEVEYIFKHALTQDVAYGTVLQEQRKALHGRTAQALESLHSDSLDDHYSALAHHYSLSGNTEKAVEYLGLAGQQAAQRSANAEAIQQLSTALDVLQTLPETPARARRELTVQTTLGSILMTTKGYVAPEVVRAYTRGQELCEQVGTPAQLVLILAGLAGVYSNMDLDKALANGRQLLDLCQRDPRLDGLPHAYWTLASASLARGELAQARDYATQGFQHYDPVRHRDHAFLYGEDRGVVNLLHSVWSLWYLGYPDQAVQLADQGLSLGHDVGHPYSMGFALMGQAFAKALRREGPATGEQAEAIIALAEEHGFLLHAAFGTVFRGHALVLQGQAQEGSRLLEQGIGAFRALQITYMLPIFLSFLAQACVLGDRTSEGLRAVEEALGFTRSGRRLHEPELHRLKGELTLQKPVLSSVEGSNVEEEAEPHFLKALEVARHQEAKSLELRAAISLARLWQGRGKTTEARELLAPVYDWFTEGFDTADLIGAKALLDELAA